jgi:hypothetical protein
MLRVGGAVRFIRPTANSGRAWGARHRRSDS